MCCWTGYRDLGLSLQAGKGGWGGRIRPIWCPQNTFVLFHLDLDSCHPFSLLSAQYACAPVCFLH